MSATFRTRCCGGRGQEVACEIARLDANNMVVRGATTKGVGARSLITSVFAYKRSRISSGKGPNSRKTFEVLTDRCAESVHPNDACHALCSRLLTESPRICHITTVLRSYLTICVTEARRRCLNLAMCTRSELN